MKKILNKDLDNLEKLSKSKIVETLKEQFNIVLSSVETKTELQLRLLDKSKLEKRFVTEAVKEQLEQVTKTELIYLTKLFAHKSALKYYRVYFDKSSLERVL